MRLRRAVGMREPLRLELAHEEVTSQCPHTLSRQTRRVGDLGQSTGAPRALCSGQGSRSKRQGCRGDERSAGVLRARAQ